MKLSFWIGIGVIIAGVAVGCNSGTTDSVKAAKDSNAVKHDSQRTAERPPDSVPVVAISKMDADFIVNAASGGMLEVELGQLAQLNGAAPRVKAFGAMMIKDHGEGGEKLKALAAIRRVTLPSGVSIQQQKDVDRLKKKKGDDFDKAYIRLMVSDHKDDIKEFEKQATQSTDSLTRNFATQSLDMLHRHLDSANHLLESMGIAYVKGAPPTEP
jgi:putative membrane protein